MDVFDALSNVCDAQRYYVYDYPPPDMTKGCQAFVGAVRIMDNVFVNVKGTR